jgi:hypothetical protein
MDASDPPNHEGNGSVPPQGSPPSDQAAPNSLGAPAGAPTPDAPAGAPEPLVVVDRDPEPPKPRPRLKPMQVAFLAAFAENGNITMACRAAKVARATHYNWLNERDADGRMSARAALYRELFEEAAKTSLDILVEEARRRAVEGWEEPVFYKGDECGTVRKFDSTLLMFLIKQRDPSYREKYEVTGAGGKPLHPDKIEHEHTHKLDLSILSDNELDEYTRLVSKLAGRGEAGTLPGQN